MNKEVFARTIVASVTIHGTRCVIHNYRVVGPGEVTLADDEVIIGKWLISRADGLAIQALGSDGKSYGAKVSWVYLTEHNARALYDAIHEHEVARQYREVFERLLFRRYCADWGLS